jgi:hypothetical protein
LGDELGELGDRDVTILDVLDPDDSAEERLIDAFVGVHDPMTSIHVACTTERHQVQRRVVNALRLI